MFVSLSFRFGSRPSCASRILPRRPSIVCFSNPAPAPVYHVLPLLASVPVGFSIYSPLDAFSAFVVFSISATASSRFSSACCIRSANWSANKSG